MQTNIEITTSTIPQLMGYQDSFKNIETHQLRGEDAMIEGALYQIVTSEHMLEIQNLLHRSLRINQRLRNLETNVVLYERIFMAACHKRLVSVADQEQQKGQQVQQILTSEAAHENDGRLQTESRSLGTSFFGIWVFNRFALP